MKRLATLSLAILMLFVSSYTSHAYSEIDSWFEAEFEEALNVWKIVPEDFVDKNLEEDITRGEFSLILVTAYNSLEYSLPGASDTAVFSDTNSSYINVAYQLGFVSGYEDGSFKEHNPIKRQEMFTMLSNFLKVIRKTNEMDDETCDKVLEIFNDDDAVSQWAREATAMMKYHGIVNGSTNGNINPLSNTSRIEGIVLVTRMLNASKDIKIIFEGVEAVATKQKLTDINVPEVEVAVVETQVKSMEAPAIDFNQSIYKVGYNSDKEFLVFGTGGVYTSGAEANQYMENVTIDVWTIDAYGNKYPSTRTIKVNAAIADMVKNIFAEIFAGEEKYPIKSVMSYAWRSNSDSEHRLGLAIDINPNENYMIRSSGSIVAGSYWKPGVDPYSIRENGDVVNAFAKYGFAWGGNAWRSANDYMHFSYFGN